MGNVLLDNWIIEQASLEYLYNKNTPNITKAFCELIQAVTLWDTIYYIENEVTPIWIDRFNCTKLANILKPIRPTNQSISAAREYANEFISRNRGINLETVEVRSLEYFYLCSNLKLNYLPSFERTEFFEKALIKNKSSRELMLGFVDKQLEAYIDRINLMLDSSLFRCPWPVFIDYFYSNCNSLEDVISKVVDLRESQELRDFRKWLDHIQLCIDSSDLVSLESGMLRAIQAIESITNRKKIKKSGFSISITVVPALNIPIDDILNRDSRKSQLLFIRTLAEHAITNSRI